MKHVAFSCGSGQRSWPVGNQLASILEFGELPIIFWLLICGGRVPATIPPGTVQPATA